MTNSNPSPFDGLKPKILNFLAADIAHDRVASAVGCDPSYISLLLLDQDFVASVSVRRNEIEAQKISQRYVLKRDMDLIREILFQLEQHNYLNEIESRSAKEIAYHVSLLEDAGLVTQDIYMNTFLNDSLLDGIRITWAGHEFLDSSRNLSIWEKAKKIAMEKTGGLSFEVLKAVLVQLGKEALFNITT